jgi:hypothetical protein
MNGNKGNTKPAIRMKTVAIPHCTLPLHSLLTLRKFCIKCHAAPHFEDLAKADPLNYPGKKGPFLCRECEAPKLQDGVSQKCHII